VSGEVPIACSLTAGEMVERRTAWESLVSECVVAVVDVPAGVRVSFRPEADVEERVREMVVLEEACCPFFRFTFPAAGELVVEAPLEAVGLARGLFAGAPASR
jgi:hypothetical protein